MTNTQPTPALERTLLRLLTAGVWLSAGFLLSGLVLLLLGVDQAANGLLHIGLIVLMVTPVLRVVLSAGEAFGQRDWFGLWTTLAVAAVLAGTAAYSLRAL